ncbi:MAG: transporter related protein [Haloplasmataceae bacterium]|jgi:ABC-type lipoprotein export system ATPase subunit/ABC-type antimicrobial peptide transport system permease subunit|nr:transporter related protein [Haloplasmataceae bacterium]
MLSIKGLHKNYKSKEGLTHQALRGIDLEFGSKGFIVLLGKSGSGKSTLLNILGGLDNFDTGEIIIKDKSTVDFKAGEWDSYRNTYVGFVFQEFYIIDEYSVGKNIALALELQGFPKNKIDERVTEILSQVDLDGYMNRRPNEISGGQKQRIAIARALVKDPQIILADEPTGNLDSETGVMILETLKKLSKDKLVIMVTHDADFAREYGDRIIELMDGKVINDQINYNQSVVKEEIYEVNDTVKSVIRLPKGKQLTQKMINYLNESLLSEKKDLYLSITDKLESISKFVTIDHENAGHDNHYDVESHLKEETSDSFALKKSSLPFKHAFKLALSSLFQRKIRLVMISFLFVVSLVMVGIAANFTFYDIGKATFLTFNKANITFVPIIKTEKECFQGVYCNDREVPMKEEDITYFKEKYKDINFSTSVKHSFSLGQFVNFVRDNSIWNNMYDSDSITRLTFVDDNETYTIIHGTDVVQDNDILITDYIAEMLVKYNVFTGVDSIEDLVGKKFNLQDPILNITGIVDTDYERFAYLKERNEQYYDASFNLNRDYFYQQLFLKRSTYELVFNNVAATNIKIQINYEDQNVMILKYQANYQQYLINGEFPNENNEITPTINFLLYRLGLINKDDLLPSNGASLIETLESLIGTEVPLNLLQMDGFKAETNETTMYKIVGIIDDIGHIKPFDIFNMPPESAVFTDSEFRRLYESSGEFLYRTLYYVTAQLGDNNRENEIFMKDLEKLNYRHQTEYSSIVYSLGNTTKAGKNIFYAIGAVFSIFTAFMIFTFISASIVSKRKEIGTLRAIGARGFDVSKIFLTEGLIIAFISGLLGNILVAVIVRIINNSITANFDIPLVLLYVSLLAIIIVFGLAVIVVLIATYLPLKRITLMKPIKAIKNN